MSTYTYPSGFAILNTYKNNGYLESIRKTDNNSLIWSALDLNSSGQTKHFVMGNNLHTYKSYDEIGRLKNVTTDSIQDLDYDYLNGRLFSREDNVKSLIETFSFDNLDRLELSMANGTGYVVSYDPNGNISNKTDVGDFNYGEENAGPHALTSVDNSTGLISEIPQLINYTSFDKIADIEEGIYKQYFTYGPGQIRKKIVLEENSIISKEKYYVGNYEKEITGSNTRELHYINTPDGIGAIFEIENGIEQMYYVYKDHLGSPYCITNANGNAIEYLSYDAWGKRRNPDDWTYTNMTDSYTFDRGFTGHEHMPEFGLINMNGRLYDPVLSRMLNPDNYVQAPGFTQSFNRYSYCLNNPLKYTDPSGEAWWHWALGISDIFTGGAVSSTLSITTGALGIGASTTGGLLAAGASTFSSSLSALATTPPHILAAGATTTGALLAAGITTTGAVLFSTMGTTQTSQTIAALSTTTVPTAHLDLLINGQIGDMTENAFKIDLGMMNSLVPFEGLQAHAGNYIGHYRNITGQVTNVENGIGYTLINGPGPGQGLTLGSYINGWSINPNYKNDPLFVHEFGHTIQSKLSGPMYMHMFGFPSGLSGLFDYDITWINHNHDNTWFEINSNQFGNMFFPGVIMPGNPAYPRSFSSLDIWLLLFNPLILL